MAERKPISVDGTEYPSFQAAIDQTDFSRSALRKRLLEDPEDVFYVVAAPETEAPAPEADATGQTPEPEAPTTDPAEEADSEDSTAVEEDPDAEDDEVEDSEEAVEEEPEKTEDEELQEMGPPFRCPIPGCGSMHKEKFIRDRHLANQHYLGPASEIDWKPLREFRMPKAE